MPKMKGASWDSMFLTFVKLATTISAIAQTKILSVGLSLEAYGTYSQAMIVVSLCTSILLLGLGDAINYFFNSTALNMTKTEKVSIVSTIFGIELVAGIICMGGIILGRNGIVWYFSNPSLAVVLVIVAVQPMLDNMMYLYQVLFVSTGQAKLIAFRNLIVSICKLCAIAVAVMMFNDIKVVFGFIVVLNLSQLVFFSVYFTKERFLINPLKINTKYIRRILEYAIPMGVFTITTALSRDIDKLIIGYMADTETVAIYANCSKLLPLDIIVASFATVLIPYIMKYISSGEKSQAAKLFNNYLSVGYYSVWTLGVAILIVSDQAISFLYSAQYLPGKMVFNIYIVDSMVKFASMHLILTANGNSKTLMKYSIWALIFNAILNVLLYKLIGIIGPAVSTLIITTIYTCAILRKSKNILNASWNELIDLKHIACFILGLLIDGIVFYIANKFMLQKNIDQNLAMIVTMGGFCITILTLFFQEIKRVLHSINSLRI